MLHVTPDHLPLQAALDVPRYRVGSQGRTPVLIPAAGSVILDHTSLDGADTRRMASVRADEWTLRGLIAVQMEWLTDRLAALTATDPHRPLGAEVDGAWYFVSPVHGVPTVLDKQWVIVGLYR